MNRWPAIIDNYLISPNLIFKNILWRIPRTISFSKHVFVVGSPRSGTTLLQNIIRSHSNYWSIEGETGAFTWQNFFSERRHHFGMNAEILAELYNKSPDIVSFFDKIVSANKPADKVCFVEKTPQHVMHLKFIKKHFPKSKIINIVRDGRDCYCSALSHGGIPSSRSIEVFANYWKKCVKKAIVHHEDRNFIINVRYEDLTKDPYSIINEIMNFLGSEPEAEQLDSLHYGNDRRSVEKRFKRLNEKISQKSVGKWNKLLSDHEISRFEKIERNELQYFGYRLKFA